MTFESETRGIRKEFGDDKFDAVVPPVSLLAEFPVAVVDKVVDERGSTRSRQAYLDFLYTPEGQTIIADFGNRVHDPAVAGEFKDKFPKFGWSPSTMPSAAGRRCRQTIFAEGALLDQIYAGR